MNREELVKRHQLELAGFNSRLSDSIDNVSYNDIYYKKMEVLDDVLSLLKGHKHELNVR